MLRPRLIHADELHALLDLYQHLHTSDASLPDAAQLNVVWSDMLADHKLRCFVSEQGADSLVLAR